MDISNSEQVCRNCNAAVNGKYCANCGQKVQLKRISLHDIIHEVFHFFTHLDKGFPYTLKSLMLRPGRMQKEYLDGDRSRHQKPFSMFFLSATISGLIYYWINTALIRYMHAGDRSEAEFFNRYWVILHICLFPAYALITYLFFRKSRYYFGEIAVAMLYKYSAVFLILALLQLVKFAFTDIETRYIEIPVLIFYSIITNLHLFPMVPRWENILRTILNIVIIFLMAAFIQDTLIEMLLK